VEGHVQALIDAAKEEDAASDVRDIVEEFEAEARESKKQQLPLQRIESALATLKQVVIDERTEGLEAISKALQRTAEHIEKLSSAVDKARSRHK
jgi:hydrogenase maturation factor HypE